MEAVTLYRRPRLIYASAGRDSGGKKVALWDGEVAVYQSIEIGGKQGSNTPLKQAERMWPKKLEMNQSRASPTES